MPPLPESSATAEPERPSATLLRLRSQVHALARQHGAERLWVFGSVVRGEDGPGTDIDLLVDHPDGGFDPSPLRAALEGLLGVRVDLVSLQAVPTTVRERLLAQSTPV